MVICPVGDSSASKLPGEPEECGVVAARANSGAEVGTGRGRGAGNVAVEGDCKGACVEADAVADEYRLLIPPPLTLPGVPALPYGGVPFDALLP